MVYPLTSAVGTLGVITCLRLRAMVDINADLVISSILALSNLLSNSVDIALPRFIMHYRIGLHRVGPYRNTIETF